MACSSNKVDVFHCNSRGDTENVMDVFFFPMVILTLRKAVRQIFKRGLPGSTAPGCFSHKPIGGFCQWGIPKNGWFTTNKPDLKWMVSGCYHLRIPQLTLWWTYKELTNITIENHIFFWGKTHYFNGHVQVRKLLTSPQGTLRVSCPYFLRRRPRHGSATSLFPQNAVRPLRPGEFRANYGQEVGTNRNWFASEYIIIVTILRAIVYE